MLWMTYGCTVQKGYPPQDRQPATYINTKNAHTTYKNSSKPKPEKGRPYNKAEQKTTHTAHDTNIVKEARKWIGTPYRYAGNNRSGTDCSGLTMELYRNVYGIKLPRSSAGQQEFCKHISRDQLEPGDLVFFATSGNRSRVSHVALYIGNGRIIHASPTYGVVEANMNDAYFERTYHSAGKVVTAGSHADNNITPSTISPTVNPRVISIDSLDQIIDSIYATEPNFFD